MMMKISKDRTILDLQTDFNTHYPYLKIVFYNKPHLEGAISKNAQILPNHIEIGNLTTKEGEVLIYADQKVGAFEQMMAKNFDLYIQVFRKSYGEWLQTWATDMWTLEEQNNRSRILGDKN